MRALVRLAQFALAVIMRAGQELAVPSADLVIATLVVLSARACRSLIRTRQASAIDESLLTGESVPVEKITDPLNDMTLMAADQIDMAFTSTAVAHGRARPGGADGTDAPGTPGRGGAHHASRTRLCRIPSRGSVESASPSSRWRPW